MRFGWSEGRASEILVQVGAADSDKGRANLLMYSSTMDRWFATPFSSGDKRRYDVSGRWWLSYLDLSLATLWLRYRFDPNVFLTVKSGCPHLVLDAVLSK